MTPKDDHEYNNGEPGVAALADDSWLDEGHLRLILDSIPAPVSYVDTSQRFRYNNSAYDRWVGRPHLELYGAHMRDVLGEKAYAVVRPYAGGGLGGEPGPFRQELGY